MITRVFISYAREDKVFVERLYSDLMRAGVKPWLDSMDLIPGQRWERAIREAISDSSYFVTVLSKQSVGKKGYVHKEIRYALEIAEEYPEDKIFIIPVRIDPCEPSFEHLKRLHRTDFFPFYEEGLKRLLRAFNYKSEKEGATFKVDARKQVGTIKKLVGPGVGFLTFAGGDKDIFFHHSELRGVYFSELREGDSVEFSIAEGPKAPFAIDIERM